mmetsp:Transcript_11750/g.18449  ORF Transcript_11750/g.18449 Transcript_11750/m.18449 type:complete len:100 (+) Transcript_11750:212-511(+)
MQDDESFIKSQYSIHLKKSAGLGEGVRGYGMQFQDKTSGPTVSLVASGGEASRSGLVQEGDVLKEVDGKTIVGRNFTEIMEEIISKDSCKFTFASAAKF